LYRKVSRVTPLPFVLIVPPLGVPWFVVTDQGIEIVLQKQYDIDTMKTKYRWDTRFGVVMTQPQMAGIVLFSQS